MARKIAEYKNPSQFKYPGRLGNRESAVIQAAQLGIDTAEKLVNAVSQANANDVIVLAPVEITLTETLSITQPVRIVGAAGPGAKGTKITGDFDAALVDVDLAAQDEASEVVFENIYFKQSSDNTDVIDVDNGTVAQNLTVVLKSCTVEALDAASTGNGLDIDHTGTSNEIQVKISGDGWQEIAPINFAIVDAADLLEVSGVKLQANGNAAAVITDDTAVAAVISLKYCEVPHEKATSGGATEQLVKAVYAHSNASGTLAAVDTSDLIGSHTETIVS